MHYKKSTSRVDKTGDQINNFEVKESENTQSEQQIKQTNNKKQINRI